MQPPPKALNPFTIPPGDVEGVIRRVRSLAFGLVSANVELRDHKDPCIRWEIEPDVLGEVFGPDEKELLMFACHVIRVLNQFDSPSFDRRGKDVIRIRPTESAPSACIEYVKLSRANRSPF